MPTAARLIAALCLAVLGFVVSEMIKPLMPEGTSFGVFSYLNTAIGLVCGWSVVGSRAGRGFASGIGNGLTGTAALVFWALFAQGIYKMVSDAMRNRYDGPVEAFAAIFEIIGGYLRIMNDVTVIATLVIGALLTGLLTELAGRAWR